MIEITRKLRDAFVNLDTDAHNPLATAEALALLGRFYLDAMRRAHPDLFYGMTDDQAELRALENIVLAFEALVRAHRTLDVAEFGGSEGFLEWSRELGEQPGLQWYNYAGGENK